MSILLAFGPASQTRADFITADFRATPGQVGINGEVELKLVINVVSGPLMGNPVFSSAFNGGSVSITDGQGNSFTSPIINLGSVAISQTFIFDTIYTGPAGTFLATFTAQGILNNVLCCFSPGRSINVDFDLSGTAEVVVTTPLPAAFPLFATGLGVLGLLGWRRRLSRMRIKLFAIMGAMLVSLFGVQLSRAATVNMNLTVAGSFDGLIGTPHECSNQCIVFFSPVYSVNPGDTINFGTMTFGTFTSVNIHVPVVEVLQAGFYAASTQTTLFGLPVGGPVAACPLYPNCSVTNRFSLPLGRAATSFYIGTDRMIILHPRFRSPRA